MQRVMAAAGRAAGTVQCSHSTHAGILTAAAALKEADAILETTGAGFGVDSGLPDFRGNKGFWKAYPPMQHLGLGFTDCANPGWFESEPAFAWGFYGHRLGLYRKTVPHDGFHILQRWIANCSHGGFAFTSNVDGQLQKAGFGDDAVVECHGSIDHTQCIRGCGGTITPYPSDQQPRVDTDTFRADPETILLCPAGCGEIARPNILMFGDYHWISKRTDAQKTRFYAWLRGLQTSETLEATSLNFVVVEAGAGNAVPTVRRTSEHLASTLNGTLIRINPTDSDIPTRVQQTAKRCISIPTGSLAALSSLDGLMARS